MPKGRVLAVDDQRYFRELVDGLLSEEGFETQTASSGEEALRLLEQAHFDIVLTDLVMPGMDGSELVHRIKQRDPEQDVVVVTGVVDVKTAVEAMKLGATDYLLKPFDRTTLASTLENILQRRRLRAEHPCDRVDDVGFSGPVGPDDNGDPRFEEHRGALGERLETLEGETFQEHGTPEDIRACVSRTGMPIIVDRPGRSVCSCRRWSCGESSRGRRSRIVHPRARTHGARPGSSHLHP